MNFINQLLENLKKKEFILHLTDVQLISKYNKESRFLLYAIDLFSKYAWVVPLKDKKGVTIIVNAFQSIFRPGPE